MLSHRFQTIFPHLQDTRDDKPADVLLHDGGQVEGVDQVEDGLHLLISLLHSQGHPVSDQPVGKGLGCVLDQVRLLEHPRGVGASLA